MINCHYFYCITKSGKKSVKVLYDLTHMVIFIIKIHIALILVKWNLQTEGDNILLCSFKWKDAKTSPLNAHKYALNLTNVND